MVSVEPYPWWTRLSGSDLGSAPAPGRMWNQVNSAEVEETLKRIQAHQGVVGIIILEANGLPIKTTMDNSTTVQYASVLCQFTAKARSGVRDIDPQNDLTFIRIRTKKHEIMIAPDGEYILIVIQEPPADKQSATN